jgi:hypothetical protein
LQNSKTGVLSRLELGKKVQKKLERFYDISPTLIRFYMSGLAKGNVEGVVKTAGGYKLKPNYAPKSDSLPRRNSSLRKQTGEKAFYKPFADWLKSKRGCGEAKPIYRNFANGKWGTPDVVGTRAQPSRPALIITTEIKIKITQADLVTAFGQACAYQLFSHEVYLVIPRQSEEADKKRMASLCQLHGINLVYFDNKKTNDPDFTLAVDVEQGHLVPDTASVREFERILHNDGVFR